MNNLEKILNDVGHPEVYQKLKEVGVTSKEKLRIKQRNNRDFLKEYGVEDVVKRDRIITYIEKQMTSKLISSLFFITIGILLIIFLVYFLG